MISPVDYAMPTTLPDPDDILGRSEDTIDINTPGEWGMYQAYYIAEYRDAATGEPLPLPRVTAFTVANDRPAVPSSVTVDGQGVATFTWEAVPDATEYYVLRVDTDRAQVIGTTTATSWTSIEQDRDVQRALTATSVYEQDIFMMNGALATSGASDDDLAGGFGDASGKDAAPGFGVVAVLPDGLGPLQVNPGADLVAQLPDVLAFNAARELGVEIRSVRTLDALPATYPISLTDGATVLRTMEYDVEGVTPTDILAGNLDDEGNVTETWHETEYRIPYRIAGTMFQNAYTVEAADLDTAIAGARAANDRAKAALARTGATSSYAYAVEVPDIDDESQISRTAPDVPYPVNGSNPLSLYLAANLLDGQRLIDVSAYLPKGSTITATGVGLWDAFDEAAAQNPLAFVDSDVIVGYVADRQIVTVTYEQGGTAADREAEQEQVAAEIDRVIDDILTDGMSDREKITEINDYLVETAEYDYDALAGSQQSGVFAMSDFPNAWSATGVLIDKKGVCASYARAFKALADAAGLESVYVTGVAVQSGEGHAWNKVKVDGAWRIVDVTWNDGSGNAYLLQTDAEATADRTPDLRWMLDSRITDYAAS
jgi:transglutaminase-like putative cysteine protease